MYVYNFKSTLNSTGCHAIDQVSLEDQVNDQNRENTEHRTCDQKVVVISVRCQPEYSDQSECKLICITEY